jgi:5-methylcytosine-specific restriction endonuclease McrA
VKICARCGQSKPPAEFHLNVAASDGLASRCRVCCSELKRAAYAENREAAQAKRRNDYLKNRERTLASNAASRAKHSESVKAGKLAYYERVKGDPEWQEKQKVLREKNKEIKRAYDSSYRASRPEQCAANAIKWIRQNPEKRKSISKAYKARRRMQESGGDSTADIHKWEMAAPKVCYWCDKKCSKVYHVDHYQPLAKGGRHVIGNLVIACPPCNLKKNAKDPFKFAASMGRLF